MADWQEYLRWNEKAGSVRDAISSPKKRTEMVQKETGHEEEYHE